MLRDDRSMRRSRRNATPIAPRLVALAAAVFASATLLAQPAEPAPPAESSVDVPGVFSEIIDVRVVNIEVVVADAEGKRVSGLGRGDFRVRVDGVERPIDFWSEVRDGETLQTEHRAVEADDEVAALEREAHSTSYLIFIDDSF